MKCFFKYLFLVVVFCSTKAITLSQVKNIKENVAEESNQNTSGSCSDEDDNVSSFYSDDMSFGESLMAEIFLGIIKGVSIVTVEAQRHVLSDMDKYPNLISTVVGVDYGTNLSALTLTPSLRVNWGIVASDLRYSLIHDYTGSLKSFDWQVFILRIPVDIVKLNYGIGFTALLEPNVSYFESSLGADVHLLKNRLNVTSNYRWTAKKSEERYRQEFKFTVDYRLVNKGEIDICPMIGVSYQDYFKEDNYLFFNVGVKIRFCGNDR